MNIPIARTNLLESEITAVLEPLRSGWLVQGKKVKEFENQWSDFVGVSSSIAVTSCTSALHLSLVALGIGVGDEVIVPAFTWISTANVVEHVGAKVVFADIDISTFNISVKDAESKVTEKTKAIIPVHLFGLAANMKGILDLAKKYSLKIVEDAACGFGAYQGGKHVGGFGNTGCFSFHPRKSITTGEGGMIVTDDIQLGDKLRKLRDHGASMTDLQRHHGPRPYLLADHTEAGFNQRMTDIQATLGVEQMKRALDILDERKKIAHYYLESLASMTWLDMPSVDDENIHGYQSFPCMFEKNKVINILNSDNISDLETIKNDRNTYMGRLQDKGVSTRPATHAVHTLSYYKHKYKCSPIDFPNAYAAAECSISLPLFNGMKKEEMEYVVKTVVSERY